jgi:hypothetical protein
MTQLASFAQLKVDKLSPVEVEWLILGLMKLAH